MRRKVVAGNWKMNMLPNEAINFIEEIAPFVKEYIKRSYIVCAIYRFDVYVLLNSTRYKYKNRSAKYALGRKRRIYR